MTRTALASAAAFVFLPLLFGTPTPAGAHVCLVYPTPRVGPDCTPRSPQKVGPCGINERSEHVTRLRSGETIEVTLLETVDHPSHYRISFDPDGHDFPDPTSVDDVDERGAFVLADGIADADDARQTVEVTLPDVDCDACTLQLIQVMHDKQANGFGGRDSEVMDADDNDDIYYSCADLVLGPE